MASRNNKGGTASRRLRESTLSSRTVVEGTGYAGKGVINSVDRLKTAMQSGPIKTWAAMSPEERARVLAALKGGTR